MNPIQASVLIFIGLALVVAFLVVLGISVVSLLLALLDSFITPEGERDD